MAVNYNTSIVTNGLVLALDAANIKSYPGTGTTWTDLSGNGNNGTLTNGPTYSSANGGSIVFDGANDYVDCGASNSLNFTSSFSVSFWMSNSIGSTYEYYVNRWTYQNGSYRQWSFDNTALGVPSADTIGFRISSDGTDAGLTSIFSTNSSYSSGWHHITGTWDGSLMNLYVDSVLVAGPTSKTSMVSTAGQKTLIGGGNQGTSFPMSGNISEVLIYKRALSAAEVSQNFNALRGRYGV